MSNRDREHAFHILADPNLHGVLQRTLLQNLFDGVYFVDAERRITYWNRAAEELSGFASEEVLGRLCCENFLDHISRNGCEMCAVSCPLTTTLQSGQQHETEAYMKHKQGHRVPVSIRVVPIFDSEGRSLGAAEIFTDLRRLRGMDRRMVELEKLVYRDFLTGLANRHYTHMKLQHATQELEEMGRRYGLLMIDLDDFKRVNDECGHNAGDGLLKAVSQTLMNSVRATDTVGRWGGDEFVIVIADATPGVVYELGNRCRRLITHSEVRAGGCTLSVSASVGGCLMQENESAEAAVARADSLMYLSKKNGGNRTSVDFSVPASAVVHNGHDGARFKLIDPPVE